MIGSRRFYQIVLCDILSSYARHMHYLFNIIYNQNNTYIQKLNRSFNIGSQFLLIYNCHICM
nr:MAG TPA: hypothetical protein [Caudoviricetes sp.]